ncbi:nuclear transport factor 2 family protein [Aliiglaciecola sp. NS0011-25]|uniref:nuclear transport factor 2 family protein n=1 Tax=Aliiglaciecola sp. NS0011-25 TaxID=3127654 RepID=UPI003102D6DA
MSMLSTIQQLLEKQDTKTLTHALIHSSRWLLGERLHYGPLQQRGLMANWLSIMSHFESIEQCVTLQCGDLDAGVFCLKSTSSKTYFVAMFEHSDGAIKQLLQWVDSTSLATLFGDETIDAGSMNSTSMDFWPEPDPLQLSEFDPQLHQYTTHAGISDVLYGSVSDPIKTILTEWWQIWQGFDTAGVASVYAGLSHLSVNSTVVYKEGDTSSSVASWLTRLEGKLHRRYSQLELVVADDNSALVRWRIDADIKSVNGLVRVRLPIVTMLTFAQNKIESEYWVIDGLAFEKRFATPLPF